MKKLGPRIRAWLLPARGGPALPPRAGSNQARIRCRNQAFECAHWERTSYITCTVIWRKIPIHTLQKGAVVQQIAKAHNLKGQLPERNMESLATTIGFVTLNCRTLSRELQQVALSGLLQYLCVPFSALPETRMRDRPVISIVNYTIYCGDADENKIGACAIAVRNDYKNLVEEFGSTSSR
ncbi:hypothetical protein RB195_010157 [Necator americanus]|uniref:Uncharacterized protein n=1 Tax=Necator americanus TaxID=51031 RepID=A0ABR1D018_NECAM